MAPGVKAGAKLEIDTAKAALAVRALNGLGLGFGAVDIVESAAGQVVLGVDACPNLRGIQPDARKTVLGAVIKRAEAIGVARIPV
jgi:glutathione synthase/RimK-type ligase-like ATP-grasp enzyme